MYDNLILKRIMPDGFQTDEMYQFKEFKCNLSVFEVNEADDLVLVLDLSNGTDITSHLNYTGELEIAGTQCQYILTFQDSKLINIRVLDY